jgi:hypothetical protein
VKHSEVFSQYLYALIASHPRRFTMKLQQEVTFDSLSAVRAEIREWFGSDSPHRSSTHGSSRDMLLSVIIHSLAEELSDTATRERVQRALEEMPRPASKAGRS